MIRWIQRSQVISGISPYGEAGRARQQDFYVSKDDPPMLHVHGGRGSLGARGSVAATSFSTGKGRRVLHSSDRARGRAWEWISREGTQRGRSRRFSISI